MVSFPWTVKKTSQNPPDFFNRSTEKQQRLDGYRKIWEAYLSELPDPISIDSAANDNVKVNPIRTIFEVGVYFLFGDEVRFEIAPSRTTQLGLKGGKASGKPNFGSNQQVKNIEPVKPGQEDQQKAQKGNQDSPPPKTTGQDSNSQDSNSQDSKKPNADGPKGPNDFLKAAGMPDPALADNMIPEDPKQLVDLQRCWKANRKQALLHEIGLSGAIHGDVFIKFVPNGAGIKYDMPRIVVMDPANVDVVTHPDDYKRVMKWIISYNTEDDEGHILTREQEITPVEGPEDEYGTCRVEKWEIQDYETQWSYDQMGGWFVGPSPRTPLGPKKTWNYPWPPIEHCNNLEVPHMFWGLPDVDESAVELVQGIQRAMSSLNKIVRLHGSPRLFAKGVMPELVGMIDASPDGVITLPAGAGVDSDLKVLESLANMSSQIEFVDQMRKMLLEGLQIPPIALGDINTMSTAMSGINLSILYAPLLQKTTMKRLGYGDMLDRINHKLLILMGYEDTEDLDDIVVVWPESMPGSHYLERQTLLEDVQLGVSQYTALQRLGYDPEREQAKKTQENSQQMAMQFGFDQQRMELDAKLNPGQPPGGNNNPAGVGNRGGSMGAAGNSTPKNKQNPSTSKSRGGPGGG
ncbi:MAG: hypothetical protein LC723_06730 [Actinobacteria bacterium]|nr:hypothetical protein [Actinomycetota bacterium]